MQLFDQRPQQPERCLAVDTTWAAAYVLIIGADDTFKVAIQTAGCLKCDFRYEAGYHKTPGRARSAGLGRTHRLSVFRNQLHLELNASAPSSLPRYSATELKPTTKRSKGTLGP